MAIGSKREHPISVSEQDDSQGWVDMGSCKSTHALLAQFIAGYSYSIGFLKEQESKLITRAYPSVMTQLYFEFSGGISEVRDSQGKFAFGESSDPTKTTVKKRTYVKQGLGSWFDIYQLPTTLESRPIKNLKVDLFPNTLYHLFNLSPHEIANEDLQLPDLIGVTTSTLMLEEMEAATTGKALIDIVERYFLNHLLGTQPNPSFLLNGEPKLPNVDDSLSENASRYNKGERWLQKRYAEVYGMSFKQMQNNLKSQQALVALSRAIQSNRPINLTDLAFDCGYFDQAHFIKDFKRFTGMTPGQYLRANVHPDSQHLFYW
jgi:AraC-like DNA-binding protein